MGIQFSNMVFFTIIFLYLEHSGNFEINNEACRSFKIEKMKLLLTMAHPRADLLPQTPNPGEDTVVKCPANATAGGGMGGGGGGGGQFDVSQGGVGNLNVQVSILVL